MRNTFRTLSLLLCCVAGVMAATAPTLTTVNVLTGGGGSALGNEDNAIIISYAAIVAAADEADGDGDTVSFRVEAVTIGTLTIRSAGSVSAGTAVAEGVSVLDAANELVWTPSANSNGDLSAFTVVATDGALLSASPVAVSVRVGAVNDLPTLTTISTITAALGAPLGDEDTQMIITSTALFDAANEADVEGAVSAFRIASITAGGTLGLRALGSGAAATSVVVGDLVDSTMELVWTPPLNANGTLTACTVRAWDGADNSSATVALPVLVNAVVDNFQNQPFDFTATSIPIVINVPLTFTYPQLLAMTNFINPDGDAHVFVRFRSISSPGWKFEQLSALDVVLDSRLSDNDLRMYIRRDEKLRITADASVPIGISTATMTGQMAFVNDSESMNTQGTPFVFSVSAGGTGGSESSSDGGSSSRCGFGAGLASLVLLLSLSLRGRKSHA